MSETLHHLEVTIRHGAIDHRFTCSGDGRADCHLVCPAGCESWTFDHDAAIFGEAVSFGASELAAEIAAAKHRLVDGGECNLVAFVANDEAEIYELYTGDNHPFESGPVDLNYEGEYVTWSYA